MLAAIELQIISKLLVSEDDSEINTLLCFDESYFSIYKEEANYIQEHYANYGNVPDVFTFTAKYPDIDLVQVSESVEYLSKVMRMNKQRIILLDTFNVINRLDDEDMSNVWNYIGSQYDKALQLEETSLTNIVNDAKKRSEQIVEFSKQQRIPTGFPEVDKLMYGGLSTVEELLVIIARTNSGKAQPLWSRVLTPDGWKCMGDIKIGDTVIGENNDNGKVVKIFPQGIKDYYRVTFDDNTSVECCDDHLWKVLNKESRNCDRNNYGVHEVLTLKEIRESFDEEYSIDISEAIEFESDFDRNSELDGYLLGILIGSGCYENKITENTYNSDFVKNKLIEYGLFGNKSIDMFIPKQYFTAPIDVRLDLLAGLVYTNGCAINNSSVWEFNTDSDQLAFDFAELARSLGVIVRVCSRKNIGFYSKNGECVEANDTINLVCSSTFNPFTVKEKSELYMPTQKRSKRHCKMIKSIEYVGKTECQCILLDNDTHTYITDGYTVTHNSWVCTKMMESAQKNGFPVLFYSPEMQSAFLATRFDTWREHFKNSELYRGNYTQEYLNYIENLEKEETPAYIVEDKDIPDGVSVRSLSNLVKKHNIKLLIIDGLSYMKDDEKSTRDYDKYKHIATGLFNLSKQYGCAVVVAMQANRATNETLDNRGEPFPTIYNAEGSDHPARIATQVFAIRQIFETHTLDIRLEKSRTAANNKPVLSYSLELNTGHIQYIENIDDLEVGSDSPTISVSSSVTNASPVEVDASSILDGIDDDEFANVVF